MTMKNLMFLAAASLLSAFFASGSQAATTVPDWNMSGIPDAGFPHFEDAVKIKFQKSGSYWELKATERSGTHLFQYDPSTAHSVTDSSFSLKARFDSDMSFVDGNMKIEGEIPGMGVRETTLWKSKLTGFGFDFNPYDGSPMALGFKTADHSGWAARFSSGAPESVYLFSPDLSSLRMHASRDERGSISINATALTTVPVPAAAWLLGSGLIALMGMRRRGTPSALAV